MHNKIIMGRGDGFTSGGGSTVLYGNNNVGVAFNHEHKYKYKINNNDYVPLVNLDYDCLSTE